MFCPNCGNANQTQNSYCRQCGIFLPDFDKITKREVTPEQQITITSTFNFLSGLISLILTIILHFLYTGKEGTPIIIYVVIGFLTANFFWQAQAFWRTLQLKKQFPKRMKLEQINEDSANQMPRGDSLPTNKLLTEQDLEGFTPIMVTENTTKNLVEKK